MMMMMMIMMTPHHPLACRREMVILRMLVLAHLSIEAREFYPAASLLFQAKGALHAWRDQTPEVRRE
jgi:hypothetical protein